MKIRTTEEARWALSNFCKAAWGDLSSPVHIFTIPVDVERDADMILSDVIEERDQLRALNAEMLEALKDAVNYLQYDESDVRLGHHPGECCCHRCNLIRLIAKAGGRS